MVDATSRCVVCGVWAAAGVVVCGVAVEVDAGEAKEQDGG
jgi:hypothetical protein